MPIIESKLKNGTLTLDALDFATQATNVSLEPDVDESGDPLETLSSDTLSPDERTTWSLSIEAVQDFDDPDGFVEFARANAGEVVPFVWRPSNAAGGVTYTGDVKVRAVPIGGDVNSRLTTSAEWPVQGQPTRAYATP